MNIASNSVIHLSKALVCFGTRPKLIKLAPDMAAEKSDLVIVQGGGTTSECLTILPMDLAA